MGFPPIYPCNLPRGRAFEASGNHALHMLVLKATASHMHLGYQVIIFGAFLIGWFVAWSLMRAARVSEKGAHTGTSEDTFTFSICLKEDDGVDGDHQRLIQKSAFFLRRLFAGLLIYIAHRHDLCTYLRVVLYG